MADDLVENAAHPVFLHLVELADAHAFRLQRLLPRIPLIARAANVASEDVAGSLLRNDGARALGGAQRKYEIARNVFLRAEHTQARERSVTHFAGIRAEKRWR